MPVLGVETAASGIYLMTRTPDISVIIPTYHDWERLMHCLNAIRRQSIASTSYEVIIVNNDPEDRVPAGFEMPVNFRFLDEGKPGSYAARNAALKVARGRVIAFTDSDCLPDPDWLVNGLQYLTDGADRVAGRVDLYFRSKHLSWSEIYEKAFSFQQQKNAAQGFSVTANLITWRETLDDVGHFNESLMSGGDREWNSRATAMGKSIVFGDICTVSHPARASFSELIEKRKRVTGGIYNIRGIRVIDILRGLMPPVNTLPMLIQDNKLAIRERTIAFLVCYYLKIYRLYLLLRFKVGLENPSRV